MNSIPPHPWAAWRPIGSRRMTTVDGKTVDVEHNWQLVDKTATTFLIMQLAYDKPHNSPADREQEAETAYLIAAAPELLDALRSAITHLEALHGMENRDCAGCNTCNRVLPAFRALVAKAEGGQ